MALVALLLSTRSVSQPQAIPHIDGRNAAATSIPCIPLPQGVTTWDASLGSIILPTNDTLIDPNACVGGIVVPSGATLVIDGSKGPVLISSHGAGISVQGGELETTNTSATNTVTFDAQSEVASWDGINISADTHRKGDASLSYVSIAHALTAISIRSGATSSPDDSHYGLTVRNSGIVASYFDGIDAVDTPISITGQGDGRLGTLNNIGSVGINVSFDGSAPIVPDKALDVESMTFGSSVPFGETSCLPLQPCSVTGIGNDAIKATFIKNARQPALITTSKFFKAGSFGLQLENASDPVVTGNSFDHNGVAASQPVGTCPIGVANTFPPIYINNGVADLENHVTGNFGQGDGLEAIVFNGTVTSPTFTWKTATTDPLKPLGYLLDGDLNMVGGTFKVPGGSVVKAKHGTLNLNGVTLDASGTGSKSFTSLRDSTVGIDAVCSVFVQSSPPNPLPPGEWGGINLVNGATGSIANAAIRYATTGVHVNSGTSLTISGSAIGPTFADGVLAEGTPIAVTGTIFGCPTGVCSGPSSGNHGILADFRGAGPLTGGLKVGGPNPADQNIFQGSVNEAIRGVGLTGQTVDIENNAIQNAGAIGSAGSAGIYLQGADHLTLQGNDVVGSGTGNVHYPAIWLDGVSHADFSGPIGGNTGSGNGLDAIAFHGDAKALTWRTIGAGALLGYLVDGNLTVNGAFTLATGDYAPVLGGSITVKTGAMTANGAVLTSLKEQATHVPSCGSVFVPRVSGVCPAQTAGDWGGLVLDPGQANVLTGSEIRYATTGISMDKPPATPAPTNLVLVQTNIRNTSADGIATRSPLSVTQGAFTNLLGHGIVVDLSTAGSAAALTLDRVAVANTGAEGVLATGLAGQVVSISGVTVDHAGAFGINLKDADHLTLMNNTVTSTAASFPAIYLNGFSGPFSNISGNRGALNGVDAIAFHGTVTDDLIWQTPRKTSDPTMLLGYVLDNTLTMQSPHTLTVNAGDIVKVGNGGLLKLPGVNLKGDNTANSSQKVFTSMTDDSVGVATCHSAVVTGCTGAAQAGDWGGISLTGSGANGALVNAAVRYASTGIMISSQASSTFGSSTYGLVVARSSIGPSSGDGIDAMKTSISVTDSAISGGSHGINVDETGSTSTTSLRLSGNRFISTAAEAILGQALGGQPVWITDNHVQGAGTFGIRLLSADALVLRNNNVSASGGGPNAGAAGYPAIYLNGVTADFTRNVRGNVGSGNGLDVIAFHGTANGDLSWRTPTVNASTGALGYVLDGSLTINDGTLTVHPGDVVKSLGGPITLSGGTLDASNTNPATKLFTSLKDQSAYPQTCPSILTGLCASGPQQGDWGGIVITNDTSGRLGSGSVANGRFTFAATALSIDSGPAARFGTSNFGLIVKGSTISDATGDGINAQDTPISVTTTSIGRVGVHGVVATFFGGTPCVSACGTSLDLEHVTVTNTSKDGIVASGLGGRPTVVSDNTISGAGTYGIRLAGADQLTLNRNAVTNSGGPATTFRYPAIYLSGVKADFELAPGASTVAGNHGSGNGIDAMVIHGEANQSLTWLTTGVTAPIVLPLVPADHFGYMLDGGLTVDGMLTTNPGDVVKILGGAIQVNGSLVATGTTFTSLKDGGVPIKVCDAGYDSVLIEKVSGSCPAPASGDWTGITASAASTLTTTTIGFDDGLTVTGGALQFAGGAMHDIARNAIVVSGYPLSVTNVVFSRIGNDGIDSTNSGSTDVITDDRFDHVGGVSINLKNAPADLERNVFTNDANPTVKTSGGAVNLQCSSIQSGGITGDAGLVVTQSDFAPGVGVTAPGGASAENNWWGQATGPSGQLSGGVTVNSYLTSQRPTATIAVTGLPSATQSLDPVNASGAIGTGLAQATLTFSRDMNPEATQPGVSYASTTVPFTGAWNPGAHPNIWTGIAPLNSTLAPTGTHTVSASGAHSCVPDPQLTLNNLMVPAGPKTFAVDTSGLPIVTVGAADLIGSASTRVHAHIVPMGWATGAGQFVVTNLASPFDQHTYPVPALADKTTPVDVALVASGLSPSSTYRVQFQIPSVNGTASEPTLETVTTTAPASKVVFTSSPPASIAAGAPFLVAATTEDPAGNVVSDFTGTVTIALSPTTATLSGTLTQSVVNGVATFSGLSVNKTGSYTLTATSSPSLTSAVSSNFTIVPATATHLVFTTQPSSPATAGSPFAQQPVVTVEDSLNNVVTTDNATSVTLALTSANGAMLSGTTSQTASNGVASFTGLSVNKAGSYTFTATSTPPLTSALSNGFTIQPSAATQLMLTTNPSGPASAGVAFSVTVTAEDAFNNTATGYTGTVHFTSSDGLAALPSNYTFGAGDNGAHTFTNAVTLQTAGPQTVTATDTVTGTITGSVAVTVNAGGAASLSLSAPATATAGTGFSVTVTAKDSLSNTATGYTGTIHLTSSDGQAVLPADYTFVVGDNGVHTFTTGVILKTAGSQSVAATDTVTATITGSAAVMVNAGTAASLELSAPASATAGTDFSVTVTARDAFTNTATGYAGTVSFSGGGTGAALPAMYTFVAGDNGAHTFTNGVTLQTAGSQTITVTDGTLSNSATAMVSPAPTSQLVFSGLPASVTAGNAASFMLTAEDPFGNSTPAYSGTVHFTGSDGQAVLPSDTTFAGATVSGSVTFKTAGAQTISAHDTASGSTIAGTSSAVTVNAGAAASLQLSTPASATAGTAFSLTVTARDAFTNTATGYTGTIHLTSSDGQAVLAADYTFVAGDNGAHTFTNGVTLKTAGSQSVTATDTGNNLITGSQTVTVSPAAASNLQLSGLSGGVAGTVQTATVTATDAFSNTATGYTGTIHFTSTDGQPVLLADYTFVAADNGVHTFTNGVTLKTAGTQSVTATDTATASLTATQSGLVIIPAGAATLQVIGLSAGTAGVAQTATVTARDAFNNTATGYTGTIHFTSTDGHAVLPADYTFLAGDSGTHGGFSVTLKTSGSETVTATDIGSNTIAGSQTVTVSAAAATSLQLSGLSGAVAGTVQTATVTARDDFNNVATGYAGTVQFTSSDGQAVLPSNYLFVAGDNGSHAFGVTLTTAATQSVTVTDTVKGTLTATQNGLIITPAAAATLTLTYTGPVTHGVPFDLTVTAKDAYGNTATGYVGTVHFTSSDLAATLPPDYTFQAVDSGVTAVSVTTSAAGTPTVTATDTVTSSITGTVTVTAG